MRTILIDSSCGAKRHILLTALVRSYLQMVRESYCIVVPCRLGMPQGDDTMRRVIVSKKRLFALMGSPLLGLPVTKVPQSPINIVLVN